jgi:hypothetical protein
MPNNAELKLLSCGLEVADSRKKCDCGIAELRLRSNMSLKSCGIAIAEELPSSCGIAIADSKKSCAYPPLLFSNLLFLLITVPYGFTHHGALVDTVQTHHGDVEADFRSIAFIYKIWSTCLLP